MTLLRIGQFLGRGKRGRPVKTLPDETQMKRRTHRAELATDKPVSLSRLVKCHSMVTLKCHSMVT
jgi:hypothetical protein